MPYELIHALTQQRNVPLSATDQHEMWAVCLRHALRYDASLIYVYNTVHNALSIYTIKYKLVKKLGPTNKPTQNTTFPKMTRFRRSLLRLATTSGICSN